MTTNRKLQTAIHLALGLSVGALAISLTPSAFAQDTDTDEDKAELPRMEIEETVVTGSRIPRADIASASPVTVLDRDEILATGVTDVGGLLQRMPSMSGSPIGTTINNGGDGSVQIDLRGMGVDRTVTLINGQRVVNGQDYQTIPTTMIERVEILKDGASAIYGADAVAGVVNIITRRDFEGMEVSGQYAGWDKTSNGAEWSVGLVAGTEFDRGNIVFGLEHVDQEGNFQSDTPWGFMQDSPYVYPAGCEKQLLAPYDGTPTGGCYLGGSSRIPESFLGFITQGTFLIDTPADQPYQAGLMAPYDGRNYNYAPVNYLQTPYQRTNLFAETHFDINDKVRFNAEFRANFRKSRQNGAPVPYDTRPGLDPGFSSVYNGVAYNGISQDNYYLRQAVDKYNAANGTSLVYEPVSDLRRRMIEAPRTFDNEIVQYQYVVGLEGSFSDMNWDVFLNQGFRSRGDVDRGQLNGPALQNALGPSADLDGDGMPECYGNINDPDSLIAGCVPLNMFGGGSVVRETGEVTASSITEDMLKYVSTPLNDSYKQRMTAFGANLNGSLFELPGGELGWALGYQHWEQRYSYSPDSAKFSDRVSGNTGEGTDGKLKNDGYYLEVLAPVWDNGTQSLILKGGLRYDDWNAFKGDETWQLGVELQVLDSLKLRGTAGTVFRVPTITDLYGGTVDSFPQYDDPCVPAAGDPLPPGCAQLGIQDDSQVLAKVGGNPFLSPETGDTWTAGLVWSPEFGDHNITTTVDYWEIDLKDGISSLGVQFILDDCYINQNETACALVTRRPNYAVQQVIDGSLNLARQGAKGVDTEVRWDYNSRIGHWNAAVLWSHLIKRTKEAFPGSPVEEKQGTFTDNTAQDGGSYAEDKVNFTLQWAWNDLSIGYLGEYISSMDSEAVFLPGYFYKIPSKFFQDIVATYTWGGITITGGITNFTNEDPPFIDYGFNGKTDPSTYRLFGRGYYMRVAWKF